MSNFNISSISKFALESHDDEKLNSYEVLTSISDINYYRWNYSASHPSLYHPVVRMGVIRSYVFNGTHLTYNAFHLLWGCCICFWPFSLFTYFFLRFYYLSLLLSTCSSGHRSGCHCTVQSPITDWRLTFSSSFCILSNLNRMIP